MKVTLESTTKIVDVSINGQVVPARIWEGQTESGVSVHAYVTRIACDRDADAGEFVRELKECRPPSADIVALPARMIF